MAKNIPNRGIFDDLIVEEAPAVKVPIKPKKVARERKKFRAQILTYESLIERMDAYAKEHEMSRAEVFEVAVTEFLDRNEA